MTIRCCWAACTALVSGLLAHDPARQVATVVGHGVAAPGAAAICGTVLGARFGTGWIPTDQLTDHQRLRRWAAAVSGHAAPPETTDDLVVYEADLACRDGAAG